MPDDIPNPPPPVTGLAARQGLPLSRLAMRSLGPALVTLGLAAGLVILALAAHGGDPMALVAQGTRFTIHDPNGTWGYDGQFYYAIALHPAPAQAASFLDVPAYRYQRILFPLTVRLIAWGDSNRLAWVFPLLGVVAQAAGCWLVATLLAGWGVSPWYALVYGLWIGFGLAVRFDLPETLAFALAAGALLSFERGRLLSASLLFGLALFTKEVSAAFWLAAVLSFAAKANMQTGGRGWKRLALVALLPGLPFVAFQVWLLAVFGRIGLGSGGALSTPFLIIPYLGLIGALVQPYFPLVYRLYLAALFVPTAVIPSLWGLRVSLRALNAGQTHWAVWALLINALAILPLPYSTFSDPRGMLRFLCGMALAVPLYIAWARPDQRWRKQLMRLFNFAMRITGASNGWFNHPDSEK